MEYNIEYINLKYTLINCFLVKADKNILDISYTVNENELIIQVVLLEGISLSHEKINNLKKSLTSFNIIIKELYLTKKQFNKNKDEWLPLYYQWLDYLLFSKAEML